MDRLITPVTKKDHIEGPFDAPLTLVEYGDYECPYCGRAYYVIKEVQNSFVGKIRFVFRNFPLSEIHPNALNAAKAAEAAGLQHKFWPMHDLIYENQEALSPELLTVLAEQLQLDMKKFLADSESPAVATKIQEEMKNGALSGVNGTPSFFINGERYQGPPSYEALMKELTSQIAK